MEQLEVGIESTEEECCQDTKRPRDHQVGLCEQEYIIESNHKSQARGERLFDGRRRIAFCGHTSS